MTRSGSDNAVSFTGMKHLNTADFSSTYGVLRVRAAVAIATLGWLAAVTPASAQTNEILLQERLISLPAYELLQQRGATTPEQRSQVIAEACRSGVLGPEDCVHGRR